MALGDGIRRNIAHVDPSERAFLRDAFLELNRRFFPGSRSDSPPGGVTWWFKEDEIHQATHVHGTPEFVPWHRELVNRLEYMLRQINPQLSLHYWDWTQDPRNIPNANLGGGTTGNLNLFTPAFMGYGGPTSQAIGPPWQNATAPWRNDGFYVPGASPDRDSSSNPADPPDTVSRHVAGSPASVTEDNDIISAPDYPTMWARLKIVHDAMHGFVAMGGTHISFRDPFVFLLHSNVDRLFAMWQTAPGHPERLEPTTVYGTDGVSPSVLDNNIEPWSGAPPTVRPWAPPENEQVVKNYKHTSVVRPPCYDTLPTFPPAVTLETPTLTFNDVPEGETTVRAVVLSVLACGDIQFEITSGPAVVSGPPGTAFGTPLGTTDTVPSTSDFTLAKAHLWISYTGTTAGDVATGTVTVHCTAINQDFVVPISCNVIPRPSVAVVVMLDKSNSMNFESGIDALPHRIDVLKYSAPPFVDVIQEGNAIGIGSFDHDAYDVIGVTGPLGPPPQNPFDDLTRTNLKNLITTHAPNPMGNTAIGDAVEKAHDLLQTPAAAGYDQRAILVFTDGHETAGKYISEVTDLITTEQVFAIGLGTAQEVQPAALTELCNNHEGYLLLTGALGNDDLFRLNKYFLQILAGVSNEEIVTDPGGWLKLGDKHRIPFVLNEADIGSDVILLTPAPNAVHFTLETPDGRVIDPPLANGTPGASHTFGTNVAYYRLTFPIVVEGTGYRAGVWHAVLQVRTRGHRRTDVRSHVPTGSAVHGLRYSLNVHSYSNLRMRARLFQTGNEPGATLIVRAAITEYGLQVHNRALVRAELVRPDQTQAVLALPEIEPGVFEVEVPAKLAGVYHFRVLAKGVTLRKRQFTREQLLTGAVWRGGDNPPPSSKDDPRERDEWLCQLLTCLLKREVLGGLLERHHIDPEALAHCLKRFCDDRLR